jgi:hypothetical protein
MATFVKLYVQGESSKMPVVFDRFGTNGLRTMKELSFNCERLFDFTLADFLEVTMQAL